MRGYILGFLFGVMIGVSGIRAFDAHDSVKRSKFVETIKDVSILSCAQGTVETVQYIIGQRSEPTDCEIVAKQWVEIYK